MEARFTMHRQNRISRRDTLAFATGSLAMACGVHGAFAQATKPIPPSQQSYSTGRTLDIATFHANRRFADVKSGRIAYFEQGQGPAALFVHGVPLNGYHWPHVIDRVQHRRRCVAIDLMGLGYTEIGSSQDVSFTAQARMIAEVMDELGIERADLIANDSGGAISQIFAATYPNRLTSLTLTNCDVHDGWPPPQVLPLMERSRNGTLASLFQPMVDRPDLARGRYAKGESVPLFRS
jgi:pimeloyl-ACP methyl ester carboxylesterase